MVVVVLVATRVVRILAAVCGGGLASVDGRQAGRVVRGDSPADATRGASLAAASGARLPTTNREDGPAEPERDDGLGTTSGTLH
jgi:hypothetical protein